MMSSFEKMQRLCRKTIAACGISFLVMSPARAAMPVIDSAAIAQAVQSYEQLKAQCDTLVKQYDQQVATFKSLSGLRNSAVPFWNPSFSIPVEGDFVTGLQQAHLLGKSALRTGAMGYYARYHLGDVCARMAPSAKQACEKEAAVAAQVRFYLEQAEGRLTQRSRDLVALMNTVQYQEDLKAQADIQSRFAGESAQLQAEKMRLEALKAISTESTKMLKRQAEAADAKRWVVPTDWKKYLE